MDLKFDSPHPQGERRRMKLKVSAYIRIIGNYFYRLANWIYSDEDYFEDLLAGKFLSPKGNPSTSSGLEGKGEIKSFHGGSKLNGAGGGIIAIKPVSKGKGKGKECKHEKYIGGVCVKCDYVAFSELDPKKEEVRK